MNCPYCLSEIQTGENVILCPSCGRPHHSDCWAANGYHCAMFECNGSGHLSARRFGGNQGQHDTISIPGTGTQSTRTSNGLFGLGASAAVIVGILSVFCIGFAIWGALQINFGASTSAPDEAIPTLLPPEPIKFEANETSSGSTVPTEARKEATPTLPGLPDDYRCSDIEKVQLYVGVTAVCGDMPVNVRSEPEVPERTQSNVVYFLESGETFTIIGGPHCAHYGTWWQIKVKSGAVGWVREYSNAYGRLILMAQ